MEIEHLAAGLLAFTLLAPTAAAETVVNQLDNPGFEDGLDEWRTLDGEVDTTSEAHEGDGAALLNAVGDTTTTTLAQNVSLEDEDLPIVPNAEYEIAFAAVLNSGTGDAPEAFGQIVWKNALGETSRVDQVPIVDTDGYVEYTETFDAPEDATEAEIQFHLVRDDVRDRSDANLKVDATDFGPADPLAE